MVAVGHANEGAVTATTLGGGADKVRGEVVGEEEKISGGDDEVEGARPYPLDCVVVRGVEHLRPWRRGLLL